VATYIDGLVVDEANRVWCGGVNDLGYLEEDETGRRTFRSLREFLPGDFRSFFVRSVHRHAGRTLFVCLQEILVWDGSRFALEPMPVSSTLHAFDFEDATYISQKGKGLWRWDGSSSGAGCSPVDLAGLERETVRTAWRTSEGHIAFLTGKGILHLKATGPELVGQDTIEELAKRVTVSALPISPDVVAVTTKTAGIFFLGANGQLLRHVDRRDGLPNPNCMEPGFGRNGRLWLGVFNHVCGIDPDNVQTVFNASNGHGGDAVRVVHAADLGTLSATEDGVRRLTPGRPEGARFQPVPGWEGSFQDLAALPDGTVLAPGMHRIMRLSPDDTEAAVRAPTMFYQLAQLDSGRPRFSVGEGEQMTLFDIDSPN
jgi:hypothetical protein